MTDQTARLLRDAENYLSALHGSVARHDNLAANYGCAGCELRDKIAAALSAVSSVGQAPTPNRTAALTTAIYDALADFQRTARLASLQHAQIRQHLAEHLTGALALRMGIEPTPETVRTAVLREAAVFVEAMNEGCGGRKPCASCDAREDAATELRRMADAAAVVSGRAADETTPKPWQSDSARIGRTLIWSWSEIGKGAYGEGYRAAQAEARALLGGQRGTDADPPAAVNPQQPKVIRCDIAISTRQPHAPHDWTQRPDGPTRHCPGTGAQQPKEAQP
jgi:hypothetical protein